MFIRPPWVLRGSPRVAEAGQPPLPSRQTQARRRCGRRCASEGAGCGHAPMNGSRSVACKAMTAPVVDSAYKMNKGIHVTIASKSTLLKLSMAAAVCLLVNTGATCRRREEACADDAKAWRRHEGSGDEGAGSCGSHGHQQRERSGTGHARRHRRGPRQGDRPGTSLWRQGRPGEEEVIPQGVYDKIKDQIIARQK